jgi:NTP pyrophosphatase (non-canonical NTP hydrolase)
MKERSKKEPISIKELQQKLRESERALRIEFVSLTKREKDVLMKTVKLQEEVGELANDILATLSLQRKSKLDAFEKTHIYQEFADVVLATFALANAMRVDMDRALQDKLEKILNVYVKDR